MSEDPLNTFRAQEQELIAKLVAAISAITQHQAAADGYEAILNHPYDLGKKRYFKFKLDLDQENVKISEWKVKEKDLVARLEVIRAQLRPIEEKAYKRLTLQAKIIELEQARVSISASIFQIIASSKNTMKKACEELRTEMDALNERIEKLKKDVEDLF